jgi:hypothetical protein
MIGGGSHAGVASQGRVKPDSGAGQDPERQDDDQHLDEGEGCPRVSP